MSEKDYGGDARSLHLWGVMRSMEVGQAEYVEAAMLRAQDSRLALKALYQRAARVRQRCFPDRMYRVRRVDDDLLVIVRTA